MREADRLREEGASLLASGDTAQAIGKLYQSVELEPGNPASRSRYANALYRAERLQEALNEYEAVSLLDPSDSTATEMAGRIRRESTSLVTGSVQCPSCGLPIVVAQENPNRGLAIAPIVIGVIFTPVFWIGTPIWAIGFIMLHSKGRYVRRCPRCGRQFAV
jgi:tetratricopeptide (TPR) repeat protein